MLKSAASSGVSIDWGAFGLVVATSLVAAVVIVTFFSIALRLLASGTADSSPATSVTHRSPAITAVAYFCIAICGAVVLYGLYLVIPLFHR